MATCKDCLHVEVCRRYTNDLAKLHGIPLKLKEVEHLLECDDCEDFKDRSRFVELPADDKFRTVRTVDDLGRIVIPKRIRRELDINYGDPILFTPIDESKILLSKFTGSKEAEQALKERENND